MRGCPRPQACKEEADAALFLFSFTDRASFEELPALMGRVLGPGDCGIVRMVVGTKYPFGGSPRGCHIAPGGRIAPPGLSVLGITRAKNGHLITPMDFPTPADFIGVWVFFLRCSLTLCPPPRPKMGLHPQISQHLVSQQAENIHKSLGSTLMASQLSCLF